MISVVSQLIKNIHQQKEAAGDANRQSEYINARIRLILDIFRKAIVKRFLNMRLDDLGIRGFR